MIRTPARLVYAKNDLLGRHALMLLLFGGLTCAAAAVSLPFLYSLWPRLIPLVLIIMTAAALVWIREQALPARLCTAKMIRFVPPLCAMALRLGWVWIAIAPPQSDFLTYHTIAKGYVTHEAACAAYAAVFPHILGYPLLLSLAYRLSDTIWAGCILNILLSGLTVWMLQRLVYQITGRMSRALWAGLCLAVFPSHIFYNALLCTEILFVFLLVWVVKVYAELFTDPPGRRFTLRCVWLGILIFVCHAIRPMGWLLLAALLFHFFGLPNQKRLCFSPSLVLTILVFYACTLGRDALAGQWLDRLPARHATGWNLYVGMSESGSYNQPDEAAFTDFRAHNADPQALHDYFLRRGLVRFHALRAQNQVSVWLLRKWKSAWLQDSEAIGYINAARTAAGLSAPPYTAWLRAAADGFYHALWVCLLLLCFQTVRTGTWRQTPPLLYAPILFLAGQMVLTLVFEANPRYHFTANICILLILFLWPDITTRAPAFGKEDAAHGHPIFRTGF